MNHPVLMKHLFTLLLLLVSAELFAQSNTVPVPAIEGFRTKENQ